jgi:DNA-directed RNA polymerase specialized sigma24 family protein
MPEVAELLGISDSSVRNHADRGLRKLRRQMEVTP